MSIITVRERVITSFGVATSEQLALLREQTALERGWYADIPSFEDNAEIDAAVRGRQLIHVASSRNFRVIRRLFHKRTDVDQLPYTTPTNLAMLKMTSERWRMYADEAGIDPLIRLSVTSLHRTLSYQRCLSGEANNARGVLKVADQTKLALPATESTHPKKIGGATDFDLSGYYWGYGSQLTSIRLNSPIQHEIIRQQLSERLGYAQSPVIGDSSLFNPDVPATLRAAADDMHNAGLANRVIEYPGQPNECLHLAAHPDFLSLVA